jgi:DNA-binding response OmpR family regulator
MILVVDDDPVLLADVADRLQRDGYTVQTASSGAEALDILEAEEPDLVISDVRMPVMGGLELRERYGRLLPARSTPFVFLTSMGDPRDIVRGLESGADDYLVKPVPHAVLRAKVRALLRSRTRWGAPTFRGDLARFPFIQVLRFCETHGLTGSVEFDIPEFRTVLHFKAGAIGQETGDVDTSLEHLYEAVEGAFTIRSNAVDFSDLEGSSLPPAEVPPAGGGDDRPPGRLSTLTVEGRTFQIQTELVVFPREAVVTAALHGWKGVLKRVTERPPVGDPAALDALISSQHALVEAEVLAKGASLVPRPAAAAPSEKERFDRLFEQGIEEYLKKDYGEALRYWEEARALRPADGVISANIQLVRAKMEKGRK